MHEIKIRNANLNDAEELLKIYSYYVINTAISFEYEPPSLDEFKSWMQKILTRYPYLTAELDNKIAGYAYAQTFIDKKAYDKSAELTIYLEPNARRHGIGKRLYTELEDKLKALGILNLYACIGWPVGGVDDEYLTKNSAEFHAHLGFKLVGECYKCGYKFNRFYSMIWMEKIIGEHKA